MLRDDLQRGVLVNTDQKGMKQLTTHMSGKQASETKERINSKDLKQECA